MKNIVFKRKLYTQMLLWKEEKKGETALLIKGARRVGKSTIAEEFAKNEYESYILIDFAIASKEVNGLFEDMMNLDLFFLRLQQIYAVTLKERRSVIVFDEVQLQPLARQAIKYLVKDGRYDYIETGSLLSIKKNVKDIVIPSEETRMTLYPLDYEEFLLAMGDGTTMGLIRQNYEKLMPFGDAVHRKLMRDFRLYMLIGGMPQAVSTYLDKNNLLEVDRVKREILDLYEDDFRKIDPTGRASRLFSAIPSQLTSNASRYTIQSVLDKGRLGQVETVIADMDDSMTVSLAYHANDPSAGMNLHKDIHRYKMFIADTGLFVTLAFKDKDFTENVIYNKLLSDKMPADLGYVYENVVAQMLRSLGYELYYYTFPTESGKHNYEVDFLISKGVKICPIEVKSSGYKSHASIDAFTKKFANRVQNRYLVYTKDLRKEDGLVCLPVYLVPTMGK